jgi:beta-galactosidase
LLSRRFPGPLRNLLGIWAEEIDCLNDGERNLVQGLAGNEGGSTGPYQVRHLCELIHAESARPLATYRDDFYAGRPAVTVNHFGKVKPGMSPHATTWLSSAISSRLSARSWPYRGRSSELPPGVVATARTDGETTYVFLQNYSAQQHSVSLPQGYQDSLTGAAISAPLTLTAWDCRILSRKA